MSASSPAPADASRPAWGVKPVLARAALALGALALLGALASGVGARLGLWPFRAGFRDLELCRLWRSRSGAALPGGARLAAPHAIAQERPLRASRARARLRQLRLSRLSPPHRPHRAAHPRHHHGRGEPPGIRRHRPAPQRRREPERLRGSPSRRGAAGGLPADRAASPRGRPRRCLQGRTCDRPWLRLGAGGGGARGRPHRGHRDELLVRLQGRCDHPHRGRG